jgi:hypothetical protein
MNKCFFFRNDDVRSSLDNSLIQLTNIFIDRNIPITHAVEPANITPEVIEWLLDKKKNHPNLIEIIQHGYNHKLNYKTEIGGKIRKGEFGGSRDFNDQYSDIKKGMELMDSYFGNLWFKAFTFPYGARNKDAIKALDALNFKVVNGGISPKLVKQLFYIVGRLLNKEIFLDRKVSWNLKKINKTSVFQIDLAISIIKKYINEFEDCEMETLQDLKRETQQCLKLTNVGVLFHHRYHNSPEKIKLIENYLDWLISIPNIKFCTQEEIFEKYNS